jgi:hypothetical protein
MLIDTHNTRGKDVYVVGEMYIGPKDTKWRKDPPRWLVKGDTFGEVMDKVMDDFGTEILERNSRACLGPLVAVEGQKHLARNVNEDAGWQRVLYVCRFRHWDQNRIDNDLSPLSLYHTRVLVFGVEQEVRVRYLKMR